jgi:hypothetical protein
MRCPHCESQEFTRYRGPNEIEGITFRRHRCSNCKGLFLSAQVPVTGKLAHQMLAAMETPQWTGSDLMPNALGIYLKAELALLDTCATTASSAQAGNAG